MIRFATSADDAADARLLAKIDVWLQSSSAVKKDWYSSVHDSNLMFDLEVALYARTWQELTPEIAARLDRLRKKIEVVRKLYRYYLPDLSRPAASMPLSSAAVQYLSVLFLKAALIWRDARYLNSALKLIDGGLERDDCAFPEAVRVLAISTLDAMVPVTPSGV